MRLKKAQFERDGIEPRQIGAERHDAVGVEGLDRIIAVLDVIDADRGGDDRRSFVVKRRSRRLDFRNAILLTISCEIAAVIDFDQRRCRGDAVESTQQALLKALDLNDHGVQTFVTVTARVLR